MKIKLDDYTDEYISALEELGKGAHPAEPLYTPRIVLELCSVLREARNEIARLRASSQR